MATEIPQLTEIPDAEVPDPYVLSPGEASDLLAGHPWSRFVVIGDSVALGMGDPTEGVTFANLAQHRAKVADIPGSQLGPALDLKPDLVALVGGGNDCLVPARVHRKRPRTARG